MCVSDTDDVMVDDMAEIFMLSHVCFRHRRRDGGRQRADPGGDLHAAAPGQSQADAEAHPVPLSAFHPSQRQREVRGSLAGKLREQTYIQIGRHEGRKTGLHSQGEEARHNDTEGKMIF